MRPGRTQSPVLTNFGNLAKLSLAAAGALALAGTACSGKSDPVEDLGAPAAGQGVQLRMVSELAGGVETERCRFFIVPPEGLYVNHQDIKFTAGSHHVLLYSTPYQSVPVMDRFGNAVDTSGIFECGPKGPTAHWSIDGIAGGSQTADGAPIVADLPAGVAVKIPGGTVLLMNTHYLNASGKTLMTDARINLWTIPAAQVQQEAGFVFFYDPFIRLPQRSAGRAREVCPVLSDVYLMNAQSHMHKRGVGYTAQLLEADGTPSAQPVLYQGTEWAEVKMWKNTPPRLLKAGQQIDYWCDFQNREDRLITQGFATTDEMCMFVGLYYPRNRQFELCGMGDTFDRGFLGARWIGSGTANGAATAACFGNAKSPSDDHGDSFYGCVTDSCPAISAQVSEVARCLASQGNWSCGKSCDGGFSTCTECLSQHCGDKLAVLQDASCE